MDPQSKKFDNAEFNIIAKYLFYLLFITDALHIFFLIESTFKQA